MKKAILSSVSSQIIYILVSSIIGLALVPLTINMLGKIEYGAFELILSLILIDVFLEFGLGSTLIKYIPEHKDDMIELKTFVWSYYYIKLVLTLVSFIGVVFIGYNFEILFKLDGVKDIESIKISVYLFGVGLFISGTATFLDNFLKGFVYFGIANSARIISLVMFFLVFYLYYISNEGSSYSIVYIALIWFILKPLFLLMNITISLIYVKLDFIFKPEKFNYLGIKKSLKYMYAMTYIVMLAQIYNKLPKIILGILSNPVHVAYWGIMEKVREPLLQLSGSILRPLIPLLSDKNSMKNMKENKIIQAMRLQYVFMSFLGVLVIVHIELLINLWIGCEFKQVAQIVKITMISFIFPSSGVFLMIYYAQGKTKINTIFVTLNSSISLVLATIVFIKTKDMVLFTLIFSVVVVILNFFNIMIYSNHFKLNKMKLFKNSFLNVMIITVIYYYINSNIKQFFSYDFVGLLFNISVSIVIYIVLFFIFMKKEDKELVLSLVHRKNLE